MAIDPSIPLKILLPNYLEDEARRQSIENAKLNRQLAQQDMANKAAEREAYGQLFAGGMGQQVPGQPGAQTGGGVNRQALGQLARINPKMAWEVQKHFDSLGDDQRKREGEKWKAAGPVLARLKTIPAEQRQAFLQSAMPMLQGAGWTPEEVMGVDLSDQSIDALASAAMTVEQVISANKPQTFNVAPGGSVWERAPGGNPRLLIAPNDGTKPTGAPVGGGPSTPRPPAKPFDLKGASMLGGQFGTVTSTVRSPERNRRVGGVPNSYHLKGRAIDIARKPGVTHAQIEKAYRDAGYSVVESIDEGDHSHIAFAGSPTASDKRRIIAEAAAAIKKGVPREVVQQRLRQLGVLN